MSTILIKADNQSNKILADLAKKLGGNVLNINDNVLEDLMFGQIMDSVKTGEIVSKADILKKLKQK